MSTTSISAAPSARAWTGRANGEARWTSSELVKVFGNRVFSIAIHITQNDDDAEDVLIETFLKGSDLDCGAAEEELGLHFVTIAVREAFSKVHNLGEGRPLREAAADSCEDLVVREVAVWGDDWQQRHSHDQKTCVLEHSLRSLDPMCRTIFVLRDMEEISVEHIAKIVNRSVPAVEISLLRARLQLREMLTQRMRHA